MKAKLRIVISSVLALSVIFVMCINVFAGNQGSIKTTDNLGTVTNGNVTYESKQAVYVKGYGLTDGGYNLVVYQTAGGVEIGRSTSPITVTSGSFGPISLWNNVCFNAEPGYGDSRNGEYRVELHYVSNDKKAASDNFKVAEETPTPEPTPTPTPEPTPTPTPVVEEIPDEDVPGGPAEVEEEDVSGAPSKLPQTGGIPAEMIYGLGGLITAAGILIKSKLK